MFDSIYKFFVSWPILAIASVIFAIFYSAALLYAIISCHVISMRKRRENKEWHEWWEQHPDDCAPSEQPAEVKAFIADDMDFGPVFPENPEPLIATFSIDQEAKNALCKPDKTKSTVLTYAGPEGQEQYITNAGRMKASNAVRAEEAKRRAIKAKQLSNEVWDEETTARCLEYGSVKSMRQAIKKYCGGAK